MTDLEMLMATAEWRDGDVQSRVVDRAAYVGSLWQDAELVAWTVTGSEPVVVGGVRLGHRVTSRLATDEELRTELAGLRRLLAVLHEDDDRV